MQQAGTGASNKPGPTSALSNSRLGPQSTDEIQEAARAASWPKNVSLSSTTIPHSSALCHLTNQRSPRPSSSIVPEYWSTTVLLFIYLISSCPHSRKQAIVNLNIASSHSSVEAIPPPSRSPSPRIHTSHPIYIRALPTSSFLLCGPPLSPPALRFRILPSPPVWLKRSSHSRTQSTPPPTPVPTTSKHSHTASLPGTRVFYLNPQASWSHETLLSQSLSS